MSAFYLDPCDACGAPSGVACAWDCIGEASHFEELAARAIPDAVAGACACLICQSLDNSTPAGREYRAARVIARGLTVEASRLYAQLHRTTA